MEPGEHAPLAILGMACRVPGADNIEQFWQLLVEGRCAIVDVPPERLDRELYYDPRRGQRCKTYTSLGGIIEYRPFDASTCPVPARAMPSAEPGHLEICQVAAEACRHGGMDPFDLPLRNVGVYVGHNLGGPVTAGIVYSTLVRQTAQYLRQIEAFRQVVGGEEDAVIDELIRLIRSRLPRRGPGGVPDGSLHLAAAIISEAFGLTGPSMILDAACSSALQGLAMASRALRLGRIDMAIVGGASYYHVDSQLVFSQAQSCSAAGSRPFDERADGLVSGEGYVAVGVKRLDRAVADGDPIRAVVRGIGVSSDGRGKSLWAPRTEGQVLAIRRAYQGGLDLGRLQYIEAHATSTRLGDLTELKALSEVLSGRDRALPKIPIGGVKANIGHTLEAAGMVGLVKTVLAMQHGTIPQQIHVEQLNSGIDWQEAPFYVPTANVAWPEPTDGQPRRGAVNSFGIGGLNVHVVLDEYRPGVSGIPVVRHGQDARGTQETRQEPIAVVGAGCVFPGARTLAAFWDLIATGRDARSDGPSGRGGFVTDFEFDWRRHKLPPKQIAQADPLQLMILDATDAALADAGYDRRPYDKTRTGVVVGTVFGGDFSEQLEMGFTLPDFCARLSEVLRRRGVAEEEIASISQAYCDVLLAHMPAVLDETGGFTPSTLASRLTKVYDLMGGAATVDCGAASAAAAIGSAVDMLADGSCDMVICAAGHRAMSLTAFEAMALRGELAGDDAKGPLDAGASGHLPGEGAGVLVLRRLGDARRDGDPIRGVVRSVGAGFASSRGEAVGQAIRRAHQTAGTSPEGGVLLETAPRGRADVDEAELAASAEALGADGREEPATVGTRVGQIGHTGGASAMASLLAAMRALETREMPATVGATEPLGWFARHSSQLRLATTRTPLGATGVPPVQHGQDARGTRGGEAGGMLAGVNSIDAFGVAYHVVLEGGVEKSDLPAIMPLVAAQHRRFSDIAETANKAVGGKSSVPPGMPPGAWRIVRIGAASMSELAQAAGQAAERAGELLDAADSRRFTAEDRCRLAIVAEGADDLAAKLSLAAQCIGTPKAAVLARKDVFVGQVAEPAGRVAFLFSGQGSQYPGMLRGLVDEFAPAAEALRQIDAVLARLGMAAFGQFAGPGSDALGKDVWLTQLSLLCADTILYCSLGALGIAPDVVAGHSYGEFPALLAAGAWDFENAVLGTRARCQAIENCRDVTGRMLSVGAPGAVVEQFCREVGGHLYAANYNSPVQTVVGGDEEAIGRLESRLTAAKIACKLIPVPRPFHTPLMEPVRGPLAEGLRPIVFRRPVVPMLSGVTNRLVDDPDEIRANLVTQMTAPVRYVELIEQLANSGVRAIVEVGPRQVLTGLHAKILSGRDVAVIGCDDAARPGVGRLLAVVARLDSLGLLDNVARRPALDVFAAASSPGGTSILPVQHGQDAQVTHASSEALVFAGTPYELGRRHGEALAAEIGSVARRWADVAGMVETSDIASHGGDPLERLPDELRDELRGMAEGAGVSAEMLAIYNAAIDRGGVESAVQVAVASDGATDLLHAFDEQPVESGPWAGLDAAPLLCVYRPARGFAHAVVSRPGMIGGSAGINERGLAVSSTAWVDASDAGATMLRTAMVRLVLQRAADIDQAVALLHEWARRIGGEFLLTHVATNRVHVIRFGGNGTAAESEERVVARVAEPCEVAASRLSLREKNATFAERKATLMALAAHVGDGRGLSTAEIDHLRATARAKCSVVLSPAAGEIIVRSVEEEGSTVRRYRFSAGVTGVSPVLAGQHFGREPGLLVHEVSPVLAGQHGQDARDTRAHGAAPLRSRFGFAGVSLEEYLAAMQSVEGEPPFDRGDRVCSRFVLRLLETAIPPIDESLRQLSGPAMIVGSNPVGLALRKQIESLGQRAVVVPISDDAERTLAMVEKIWNVYRPPHLFIVTPFDEDAVAGVGASDWDRRRRRGVVLPYLVCQKWFTLLSANKMVEQGSVVAATASGGDVGLSGRVASCESGAMAGLVKALSIEVGYTTNWAFRTKVLDAPRSEPAQRLAEAMLRELRAISYVVEIGYREGRRYVVGAMHQPVPRTTPCAPTSGRAWLVTGGARGITAVIARELAARFGVKLHLVGTSPREAIDPSWRDLSPEGQKTLRAELARRAVAEKKVPAELWRRVERALEIDKNLRRLEENGADAVYHACDVSDRAAVAALVEEIHRADGPIEGVIHGAGVESACRLAKKDLAMVERTLAAKADGAAAIIEATQHNPPRFFFGFGSISGRWGSIGQTDYAAASDMLAKLIDRYRAEHPGCHAACFHWQPWAEIGMAARDETRGSGLLQRLQLLPAAEGVEFFFDELLAGAPEPEVLVTDWAFYKNFYPDLSPKDIAEVYSPKQEPNRARQEAVSAESPALPQTRSGERMDASASAPLVARQHRRFSGDADGGGEVIGGKSSVPPVSVPPERVASRHVMRMVELPLAETTRRAFTFSGGALILGDNADALALAAQLAAAGVEARHIPIRDTADATLSELQWLWADRPAPHLFLMTGRDPAARRIDSRQSWAARRHRGVRLPYAVCQKWLAMVADAELLDHASLVAATSLGGHFGLAGSVVAPEGGAASGLVKGLYTELNATKPCGARLRVIDAPEDEPPGELARAIVAELDVEGFDVEVAYAGGRRRVVRLAIEPVETLPRGELPRGGTWIVTGGARGITAEAAKAMGRRWGLNLHLLGKSPELAIDPAWRSFDEAQIRALKRSLVRQATAEGRSPGTYWERVRKDLEIDRNLRQFAAAGVRATYHCCDVGDPEQLELTIERIRQADGPIEGIVHGAGILDETKPITETPLEELEREIDVKVDAAMNMLLATADDPVRYFVGFGSISGRFGSNGAVIYSMSSDALCKLAGWQRSRRPECHAVGFHWHPWGEVGMMTHPSSRHTITVMKMKMMSPAEGTEHLIEELLAGAPEGEVLITDRQYYETFYSKDLLLSAAGDTTKEITSAGTLIERILAVEPGRRAAFEIHLDPVADHFLREHRLRDRPTLPMVVAIEAFAEAAAMVAGGNARPATIRDVRIHDAVRFLDDAPREVRLHAEVAGNGVACRLTSDFRNRRGQLVQKDRPHFSGVVEASAAPIEAALLPTVRGLWHEMQYPPRDALMYHGPPLRLLRRIAVDGCEAWGQVELPIENQLVGDRDPAGWLTPSAAIDACYYACGVYTWVCANGGVTVPDSLAGIRFGRDARPSERCMVHVVCRELSEKSGLFDFTLFGDDGTVVFRATGYRCHVLGGGTP